MQVFHKIGLNNQAAVLTCTFLGLFSYEKKILFRSLNFAVHSLNISMSSDGGKFILRIWKTMCKYIQKAFVENFVNYVHCSFRVLKATKCLMAFT